MNLNKLVQLNTESTLYQESFELIFGDARTLVERELHHYYHEEYGANINDCPINKIEAFVVLCVTNKWADLLAICRDICETLIDNSEDDVDYEDIERLEVLMKQIDFLLDR